MTSRLIEARATGTRVRAWLRTALVGASTLAVAVSIFSGPGLAPAAAVPPLTVAEAKTQVDALEIEAAAIDEQALDVKVKLSAGNKTLAMKQEDVRRQTADVARIRKQVAQVALAQFQNRNLDTTAQLLLTSDADGFLNKMATVEKVSENQNTILQDYQSSQAHLAEVERSAKVDVAGLQATDQQLASLRAASAAKIVQAKAVLARLTAQERAQIKAEEAAAQEAAEAAAKKAAAEAAAAEAAQKAAQKAADEAASAQASTEASGSQSSSNSSNSNSSNSNSDNAGSSDSSGSTSSGKGAVALAYAEKQLGKPYVWGAEGPGSFDCSGLTSSAWRAAGVSIPRTSLAQSKGAGRAIDKADLQPGDLVFFYHPVSHVAIYVGNGVVLHAPRPGKSVQYIKMKNMPYAGARRPG